MLSASFVLSILIQLVVPIGIGFFVIRHYRTGWRLAAVGVMAYLVYQVVQPVVFQIISESDFYTSQIQPLSPVWLALVIGFLSAILEQAARTGGFWFVRKNISELGKGLTVTAGYAGIESALIGLEFLWSFGLAVVATTAGPESLNLSADAATKLQQQIVTFWALPWYLPLAAALQRSIGMIIQFVLGMMVWQAVNRRAWVWLGAAVVWETAMSALTVTLSVNYPDPASLGLYVLMGLVNAGVFYLLFRKTGGEDPVLLGERPMN